MSSDQETTDRDETEGKGETEGKDDTEELSASEKAKQEAEEREKAEEEVKELEDDPPTDLSEWPGGKAKYITFGGPEGDQGYEEGVTSKLGPSEVRHHDDGTVTVGGEEVDDPDDYKGEPIPGGPTDPNTPDISGEGDDDGESSTSEDAEGERDDDEEGGTPSTGDPGPGSQNGQRAEGDQE